MTRTFIEIDIPKLKDLKMTYQENLDFIKENLPDINWNSRPKVKEFMISRFGIKLENATIAHIISHLDKLDQESMAFDVLNGYLMYLRIKANLKNYINQMLKDHENGRVYLQAEEGDYVLKNHRPLPKNPEIMACISGPHSEEG